MENRAAEGKRKVGVGTCGNGTRHVEKKAQVRPGVRKWGVSAAR